MAPSLPRVRDVGERAADPCATIGGQTWVSPADVRACYQSFPVNETEKANVSARIYLSLHPQLRARKVPAVANIPTRAPSPSPSLPSLSCGFTWL